MAYSTIVVGYRKKVFHLYSPFAYYHRLTDNQGASVYDGAPLRTSSF